MGPLTPYKVFVGHQPSAAKTKVQELSRPNVFYSRSYQFTVFTSHFYFLIFFSCPIYQMPQSHAGTYARSYLKRLKISSFYPSKRYCCTKILYTHISRIKVAPGGFDKSLRTCIKSCSWFAKSAA